MTLTRSGERLTPLSSSSPDSSGHGRAGAIPPATRRSRAWAAFSEVPAGRRVPGTMAVFLFACALGAMASVYTVRTGLNLDYGDAMAHLTISRRIIDNKSPGLQQLGTVWLPLPHLLLLPFVQNMFLFRTGIAACILGTLCLGITAASLYRIMARLGLDGFGRLAGLAVLLANPSMLFAYTTALTEPVLIAAICACIAGLAGWSHSPRRLSGGELAVFAGIPVAAGVLIRYEAWALVISGAIYVVIVVLRRGDGTRRAVVLALSFLAPPLVAIGWWLSYNMAWYGNPVEFLTGKYSAAAFTEVFIAQGQLTTKGNFGLSFLVYGYAALETSGLIPLVLAGIGLMILTYVWGLNNKSLIVWLAGTSSAFLLFSLTTGQHIMVNDVSLPAGVYNNRYVLSAVPWVALLVAFLVGYWKDSSRLRAGLLAVVVAGLLAQNLWWAQAPYDRQTVIEEAGTGRDAFEPSKAAAEWLRQNYDGGGVLMDESADKLAIAPVIGIPLKEFFNRSSGDFFDEALADPESNVRWVVMHRNQVQTFATEAGIDLVTEALVADPQFYANYRLVFAAESIGVFRRVSDPGVSP